MYLQFLRILIFFLTEHLIMSTMYVYEHITFSLIKYFFIHNLKYILGYPNL